MTTEQVRFDDGATYEKFMGVWSQAAGTHFLDWLAPRPGLRWLDVGCGNGAFTELIATRCAPTSIHAIDPSEAQLRYARTRPLARIAQFSEADAMVLPFENDMFDAAVMPLVIFFVPDPGRGLAEMARVVRSRGVVSAYAWDINGGGFPYQTLINAKLDLGMATFALPSPEASRLEVLRYLWKSAGLSGIETTVITVQRTFMDFDDYWSTVVGGPKAGTRTTQLTASQSEELRTKVRADLPVDADGGITCTAWANAVKGTVP